MALRHKPHVLVNQLNAHTAFVCGAVAGWMDKHDAHCVITSLDDSTHSAGSKHYAANNPSNQCEAVDVRTKHLPAILRDLFAVTMRELLEPMGYDVVMESPGEPNEHLHVEFDPKPGEQFSSVAD